MSRVRIVGGAWRSRLVEVPDALGLRPTPDRVRETLFNWLGQDCTGLHCLDLFAGSGALGLEAASRGAASVVMVEAAPRVHAQLAKTLQKLGANSVRLLKDDALRFVRQSVGLAGAGRFDLVFLDPPYRQGWLAKIAPDLPALLAPDARVYVEAEEEITELAGMPRIKSGRAGQVHYQLFAVAEGI